MADASTSGFAGRLTRKVGPFPVWLWAAIVIGGYLLYSHYKAGSASAATAPASSTTAATPATPDLTGAGAAGGASGGGNAADNMTASQLAQLQASLGNLSSSFDTLSTQLQTYPVGTSGSSLAGAASAPVSPWLIYYQPYTGGPPESASSATNYINPGGVNIPASTPPVYEPPPTYIPSPQMVQHVTAQAPTSGIVGNAGRGSVTSYSGSPGAGGRIPKGI